MRRSAVNHEEVVNNPEKERFEVTCDGHTAHIRYRRSDDLLDLTHVGVPAAIGGRGIGTRMVRYALEYARTNGLKVIPSCPFVRSYVQAHPEYNDLMA